MTYPKPTKGWRRCPAVTTGGKTWFYLHEKEPRTCVVWNRLMCKWRITDGYGGAIPGQDTFDEPAPALKAARAYIKQRWKDIMQ